MDFEWKHRLRTADVTGDRRSLRAANLQAPGVYSIWLDRGHDLLFRGGVLGPQDVPTVDESGARLLYVGTATSIYDRVTEHARGHGFFASRLAAALPEDMGFVLSPQLFITRGLPRFREFLADCTSIRFTPLPDARRARETETALIKALSPGLNATKRRDDERSRRLLLRVGQRASNDGRSRSGEPRLVHTDEFRDRWGARSDFAWDRHLLYDDLLAAISDRPGWDGPGVWGIGIGMGLEALWQNGLLADGDEIQSTPDSGFLLLAGSSRTSVTDAVSGHFVRPGSRLRRTLGAVLARDLELVLREPPGSGGKSGHFGPDGEHRLTSWMLNNLVASFTAGDPGRAWPTIEGTRQVLGVKRRYDPMMFRIMGVEHAMPRTAVDDRPPRWDLARGANMGWDYTERGRPAGVA